MDFVAVVDDVDKQGIERYGKESHRSFGAFDLVIQVRVQLQLQVDSDYCCSYGSANSSSSSEMFPERGYGNFQGFETEYGGIDSFRSSKVNLRERPYNSCSMNSIHLLRQKIH